MTGMLMRLWPLSPRQRLVLGAVLLALPLLLRLGAAPLFDVDEGAFSEATREMLASGDFGFTTLNGEPRFDKPILVYWLQAASVALFGLHEFALRLPSALAAWLWALVVVQFARPRLGEKAAWLAGVFTVSSLGVLAIGRAATADGLLNCLLALATLDAWRHLESGSRPALMRMYGWVGLGLLTKGPIAVLVPGAATLLYCLTTGGFPGRWRDWARSAFDGRGWLLTAVIALPWYAYALHRHGQAFIDGFFVKHNLARYSGALEGHGGSGAYYLVLLPVLLLPWSGLLPLVLARVKTLWAEPLMRFCLLWAGFVIVFFSFSGTKLPHYALYGATPCFLLAARCVAEAPRWARALAWAGVLLLLALVMALPTLLDRAVTPDIDPLYQALLGGATTLSAGAMRVAAVLAAVFFGAAWLLRGSFAATLAWGCTLCALVVTTTVTPWLGLLLQAPVRQAGWVAAQVLRMPDATQPTQARPAVSAGMPPIVQWGVRMPSFALYARTPTPQWPQEQALAPGMLALARADRVATGAANGPQSCYPRLRRDAGPAGVVNGPAFACEVLYQQRGFVLLRGVGAGR